jgi:hypothetical protein
VRLTDALCPFDLVPLEVAGVGVLCVAPDTGARLLTDILSALPPAPPGAAAMMISFVANRSLAVNQALATVAKKKNYQLNVLIRPGDIGNAPGAATGAPPSASPADNDGEELST